MRYSVYAIALVASLMTGIAMADERHHDSDDKRGMMMQGGMGMMSAERMEQHMERMRSLMRQAHDSDDPQRRRTLMREHMQEMQTAMEDMMGGEQMDADKDRGMAMEEMSMDKREAAMAQQMQMMQHMMQQMMGQQEMMMEMMQ